MAVKTAPELYAHAIAIESEAARRYGELAQRMADEGRDALAEVFGQLARHEAEHLEALEARSRGVAMPEIAAGGYHWLDAGAPETAAQELVFRLMTPRDALLMALRAEHRALAFFEHVFITTGDPALRALAREMAAEEQEHVLLIERLLGDTPAGSLDSTLVFER
jgi:rubrerythrin